MHGTVNFLCTLRVPRALFAAISALTLTHAANAQSSADLQTISRFVECRLEPHQINAFIDRIGNDGVQGFTRQPPQEHAVDLAWKTQQPVSAWGVTSNVVSLPSAHQMLLAICNAKGDELQAAEQWAARIGGMHEDAGTVSLRKNLNWQGADYRKTVDRKEVRLLVDQRESPGWILLGCRYDGLFKNND